MAKCLTDSQILLFLDARLPAHEVADVDAHFDNCPSCRQLVAAMVREPIAAVKSTGTVTPSALAGSAAGTSLASRGVPDPLLGYYARGSVIADRYMVLDELGVGAYGVVYSAFDQKLDRKLALKFVRADAFGQSAGGQSRLLREGQSLARLSHPNVVVPPW